MSTRMLIDARHTEETRVAIVKGSRVEDFDYESAAKRQLKGNIYLARITRVEPSLQAAFVEYGGNRHGFLAFSEIHPDYYQIPAEDREELIKLEQEEEKAAAEAELDLEEKKAKPAKKSAKKSKSKDDESKDDSKEKSSDKDEASDKDAAEQSDSDEKSESKAESVTEKVATKDADAASDADDAEDLPDDSPDSEQAEEIEAAERRRNMRALKRRYKIQEVIKRRQVVLIQVVKEERGNKGAALTTYVSLAGRYCVLMPNSTHSGGISRKISNVSDRKRLKSMMTSLNLPQGMGCIVRTAGLARTKNEVKRDLDYLLRLWNGIRDLTLKSIAPATIYEEGNLIKRSIRDLYSKDIDEILVEGDEGFNVAKNFITMLMPTHTKKVTHYKDGSIPLFNRYQVETQLEAMYNPNVQLRSGGYIVINPTEALISVDVNSGRATKEKNIEETAVKTNLEAAEELGRQLRLRDMAGLIVIDFIDMEDRGNNRAVERRLKDVLKSDRARIQVGRISSFGLLEMSRQRLRPNLLEASMMVCSHCDGSGVVRNVESAGLQALRALEDEGIRGRSAHLTVSLNRDVAIYMLNKKRSDLFSLEQRYALSIEIHGRRDLGPSDMEVERENITPVKSQITADALMTESIVMDPIEVDDSETSQEEDREPKSRTRRRRRRRGRGSDSNDNGENTDGTSSDTADTADQSEDNEKSKDEDDKPRSRRRRGRRGGRRRKSADNAAEAGDNQADDQPATTDDASAAPAPEADAKVDNADAKDSKEDKPKRPRRRRGGKKADDAAAETTETPAETSEAKAEVSDAAQSTEEKPKRTRRPRRAKAADDKAGADDKPAVEKSTDGEEAKPAKRVRRTKKADNEDKPATEKAEVKATKAEGEAPAEEKPKRGRPKKAAADKAEPTKKEATEKKVAEKKVAEKKTTEKSTEPTKEKVEPKAELAESKPSGPPKSGWWNKTFG